MEYIEFENIKFYLEYRKVKYARIEFNPEKPRIILSKTQNPFKILNKNKNQILKKYLTAVDELEESRKIKLEHRTDSEFEKITVDLIKEYCHILNIKTIVVKFRKMLRRWGTCYSNGKIILNKNLKFLPLNLIKYIVFHETAHLIIKGHGKKFKEIMLTHFPDKKQLEKDLRIFGLRIFSH